MTPETTADPLRRAVPLWRVVGEVWAAIGDAMADRLAEDRSDVDELCADAQVEALRRLADRIERLGAEDEQ